MNTTYLVIFEAGYKTKQLPIQFFGIGTKSQHRIYRTKTNDTRKYKNYRKPQQNYPSGSGDDSSEIQDSNHN